MDRLSMQLQDTRAVLIGGSKFPRDRESLPDLPAVETNLTDLEGILEDPRIIGIPKANVTPILNEPNRTRVLETLDSVCRNTLDTLIVYYAGHGLVTKEGSQFALALHDTTEDQAHLNALVFSEMGKVIKNSLAQRRILILDCCFSGRALEYMGGDVSMLQGGLQDTGSYSIAAAPSNAKARAPAGEKYTTFTGVLIKALREGIGNNRPTITLNELFYHIRRELYSLKAPEPQKANFQDAENIILAWNQAHRHSAKAKLSLDADSTTVVLIGASEFPQDPENLAPLPAVKNNVRGLAEALCDDDIVGLKPTNIVKIIDEPKASDVLTQLARACRQAEGTLIVYYAGHGLAGRESKQLYLATAETTDEDAEYNAMPFERIRSAIDRSGATTKVLIVDSCFSGKIVSHSRGAMSSASSLLRSNLEFDDVISIASASRREPALAPPGETYTVFTGELIRLLKEGLRTDKEVINLKELFEHIRRNLRKRPGVPEPQSFNIQRADRIILARNRKYVPGTRPDSRQTGQLHDTADRSQKEHLNGIVQVLWYCHRLLERARMARGNTSIWFCGLTCAFGPVHNIPQMRKDWNYAHHGKIAFDDFSDEFNNNLLSIMARAGDIAKVVVVTLKKNLVRERFVEPLYTRLLYRSYSERSKGHLAHVLEEIEEFQNKVEVAARMHHHVITYVNEMPRQAIVTQTERNNRVEGTACVVIEVGTPNVGEGPASGFYSESLDVCEEWKRYITSLYESASAGLNG